MATFLRVPCVRYALSPGLVHAGRPPFCAPVSPLPQPPANESSSTHCYENTAWFHCTQNCAHMNRAHMNQEPCGTHQDNSLCRGATGGTYLRSHPSEISWVRTCTNRQDASMQSCVGLSLSCIDNSSSVERSATDTTRAAPITRTRCRPTRRKVVT